MMLILREDYLVDRYGLQPAQPGETAWKISLNLVLYSTGTIVVSDPAMQQFHSQYVGIHPPPLPKFGEPVQ